MTNPIPEQDVFELTRLNDKNNLAIIEDAYKSERIDKAARDYLNILYSNSMDLFRDVFLHIGQCFGAPKAAVKPYDYKTDSIIDKTITISDINPLSVYLVNHRFDMDPMRNQFFASTAGHKIDLAVSSIVTVIVGAQKKVERAIDKITVKYYDRYVSEVLETVHKVLMNTELSDNAQQIMDDIHETFANNFITDAASAVLSIVGIENNTIAADLVRALDTIRPPYARLRDVWRIKCLFDLVPQARTFIERMIEMWPGKILLRKDSFFDIQNPRGYRDAKIVLDIGRDGKIIPLEIICQVRTFFEFEHKTHLAYEDIRIDDTTKSKTLDMLDTRTENMHIEGVKKYNAMILECLESLFDRIGWNILYGAGDNEMLFEGFPRISTVYHPQNIVDTIYAKVTRSVENEVFYVPNAPAKLTRDQEIQIFRWMAKFVLVTAMPYTYVNWSVPDDNMPGKFFKFIMKELQRYYKK